MIENRRRPSQAEGENSVLAIVTSALDGFVNRVTDHNKHLEYLNTVSQDINTRVFGGNSLTVSGDITISGAKAIAPQGLLPSLMALLSTQSDLVNRLRDEVNTIANLIHFDSRLMLKKDDCDDVGHESSLDEIRARINDHNVELAQIEQVVWLLIGRAFNEESPCGEENETKETGLVGVITDALDRQNSILHGLESGLSRLRTIG